MKIRLVGVLVLMGLLLCKPSFLLLAAKPDKQSTNPSNPASPQQDNAPTVEVMGSDEQMEWLKKLPADRTHLALVAGRSHVMRFAKKIKRISVSDPEVLDFVILSANAFAEGSVSLVQVKKAKQILLEIRLVQINRSQDYQFGLDFSNNRSFPKADITQRFLPGQTGLTQGNSTITTRRLVGESPPDIGLNNLYSFYMADGVQVFQVFVKAVESNSNVQVNYKEFGTKLKFKPEIIENGKIRLTVEPEVSSISSANGVTSGSTSVPGFAATKFKTVVELFSDQTFVAGGLLQQKLTTSDSGIPFLRRMSWEIVSGHESPMG